MRLGLILMVWMASFSVGDLVKLWRGCCSCPWRVGQLAVPHDPTFRQPGHGDPELENDPQVTVIAPAWPGANCFGVALFPLYREYHQEGLYLTDRAAEILCNAYYRGLRAGEEPRRGDLLAYLVHRSSSQDPQQTVRALVHLATWWDKDRVLSKFDSGPMYLMPPERWPANYPRVTEKVTLRRVAD